MHRMSPRPAPNSVPEGELPPALPDMSEHVEGRPGPTVGAVGPPGQAIRLTDALAMSLRNVETVQANLSVRTATVARFEALKAFVPLVNLPMLEVGLSRLTGPLAGQTVIFPDVSGGTPFVGQPGLRTRNSIDLTFSCRSILPGRSRRCRSLRRGSGARS